MRVEPKHIAPRTALQKITAMLDRQHTYAALDADELEKDIRYVLEKVWP